MKHFSICEKLSLFKYQIGIVSYNKEKTRYHTVGTATNYNRKLAETVAISAPEDKFSDGI